MSPRQGEENYLFSLVRMTLEQLPKAVSDDEEVCYDGAWRRDGGGGGGGLSVPEFLVWKGVLVFVSLM